MHSNNTPAKKSVRIDETHTPKTKRSVSKDHHRMGSIFSGDYSASSNRSKGILKPKKSNSDLMNVASFEKIPPPRQERESLLRENS